MIVVSVRGSVTLEDWAMDSACKLSHDFEFGWYSGYAAHTIGHRKITINNNTTGDDSNDIRFADNGTNSYYDDTNSLSFGNISISETDSGNFYGVHTESIGMDSGIGETISESDSNKVGDKVTSSMTKQGNKLIKKGSTRQRLLSRKPRTANVEKGLKIAQSKISRGKNILKKADLIKSSVTSVISTAINFIKGFFKKWTIV